ncbi:tetratricopeptide repeat protein, partial [Magnetococcales bacterium HHB-1]
TQTDVAQQTPTQTFSTDSAPPEQTISLQQPGVITKNDTSTKIKIRRTSMRQRLANTNKKAYKALKQGKLFEATQLYKKILDIDKRNYAARKGLASIALKQRNFKEARRHYLKILKYRPNDTLAKAGLLSLSSHTNPIRRESNLKTLIAKEPNASHLHFTLGTVYVSQRRWGHAKASFNTAYRLNPNNGDIAFNLAISLDQLRETHKAVQYYKQALKLARTSPVNFSINQVEKRLRRLGHQP